MAGNLQQAHQHSLTVKLSHLTKTLLITLITLGLLTSHSQLVVAANNTHVIDGTFIQLWNTEKAGGVWSQERWNQEVLRMKESCQNTIFIQFATHGNAAWYQVSNLDFISYTSNAMQYIFNASEKHDISVIVGLSHGSGQWDWNNDMNRADYSMIYGRHQQVVDEVSQLFGKSPAFSGWYIPQELDWIRFPHNSDAQRLSAELFQDTAKYAKSRVNKPVYVAPYFQDMNPANTEIWWDKFLSIATEVDILLPQDGGGRANADINKFSNTYGAIKKSALKQSMAFGVDIETFAPGSVAATWPRVKTQLDKANTHNPSIIVQFEHSFMNQDINTNRAQLYNDYTTWQKTIRDCTWDPSAPSTRSPFVDVPTYHPYLPSIQQVAKRGIMSGSSHFRFLPNNPISRAETAVVLTKTFNLQPTNSTQQAISDVPATHWAYSYIKNLLDNGITAGCATNPLQYCPNDPVTNAQAAIFTFKSWQTIDSTLNTSAPSTPTYSDIPSTHWAYPYIEALASRGVKWYCDESARKFCPDANITRAAITHPVISALDYASPLTITTITTPGDLNTDGQVDIFDYNILVAGFGSEYDIFDYNDLVTNYGS
jgi:hypothetical protein